MRAGLGGAGQAQHLAGAGPGLGAAAFRGYEWRNLRVPAAVLLTQTALLSDMPFDRKSYDSGPSVYSDGVMPEGGDSFVVWAGGADQVVEAVRIKVTSK